MPVIFSKNLTKRMQKYTFIATKYYELLKLVLYNIYLITKWPYAQYYNKYMHFLFLVCLSILMSSVDPHVCILRIRRDLANGRDRWALPSVERCYCTMVMPVKFVSNPGCSKRSKRNVTLVDDTSNEWWFVDDPAPFKNRSSWNAKNLDHLLDRADFCGM